MEGLIVGMWWLKLKPETDNERDSKKNPQRIKNKMKAHFKVVKKNSDTSIPSKKEPIETPPRATETPVSAPTSSIRNLSSPIIIADDVASPASKLTKISAEEMEMLKQFDLNMDYGPVIGVTRLQRYERALKLGLNPPLQLRSLIEEHGREGKQVVDHIWIDEQV